MAEAADHRVKPMSPLRRALIRPELGGICGTVLVFMLFGAIAGDSGMFAAEGVMNWTVVSAQFRPAAAPSPPVAPSPPPHAARK